MYHTSYDCLGKADRLQALTPRTQLYVHLYLDNLDDPDAVARVEGVGPVVDAQFDLRG